MKKRKEESKPASPFAKHSPVFGVTFKYCRKCGRSITREQLEAKRHPCR